MAKQRSGSTRAYADATTLADAWGLLHDVQRSLRSAVPVTPQAFGVLVGRVVQARQVVARVRRVGRDDYDRSILAQSACAWTLRCEVTARALAEIERRPDERQELENVLRWVGDLADEWDPRTTAAAPAVASPGVHLSPGGDA